MPTAVAAGAPLPLPRQSDVDVGCLDPQLDQLMVDLAESRRNLLKRLGPALLDVNDPAPIIAPPAWVFIAAAHNIPPISDEQRYQLTPQRCGATMVGRGCLVVFAD